MNDLVILKRETGLLSPRLQGRFWRWEAFDASPLGQRAAGTEWLTLGELCVELSALGVLVHRSSVGRLLHWRGLSQKKLDGKRAAAPGDLAGA